MKELSEKVDEALRNGVERGERSVNQLSRSIAMPPLATHINRSVRQSQSPPPAAAPPSPPPLPLPPQPIQEHLQRKIQDQENQVSQSSQTSPDVIKPSSSNSSSRTVRPNPETSVETPRSSESQSEVNFFPLAQQLLYYTVVVFCVYKLTGWLHIRPTFGEPTEEHSFLYRFVMVLFHWIFGLE
ncbi:unnamed protein product [Echinostoma caproni]|uniref:Uncharacterized protein n=1 Tax=Echinostoma caproni TaxID=27848 RepID=A0A183A667_9TREM|nr:unnamed protein product [Echinostoma caproni]